MSELGAHLKQAGAAGRIRRHAWVGVALAAVLAATLIRLAFLQALGLHAAFITFFPAVMLAAFYGGLRAGVLATLLSAVAASYFWTEPAGRLAIAAPEDWLALAIFLASGVMLSWIAERMDIDLTERKRAEEALRRANAYNRSLLEASPDPLVAIGPDGKITDVNVATETVVGTGRSALIGTDFCDYFTEPEKARAGYEQVFREGVVRDYPLELRRRNGQLTSVLYNACVYRDERGKVIGVFAAARDITARKRVEAALSDANERLEQRVAERTAALRESEAEIRAIYQSAPVIMMLVDAERRVVRINTTGAAFAGRPGPELAGLRGGEALRCLHSLDHAKGCGFGEFCQDCTVRKTVLDTLRTGAPHIQVECCLPFIRDTGTEEFFFLLSTARLTIAGQPRALVTIIDITARKRAEERVKLSLREKEVMLKEIHHRVKNNLQVIASLVDLQAEQLQAPSLAEGFADIRDRVRSMALVHEKLYQSADLAGVDLAEYAETLVNYLARSHGERRDGIQVRLELEPVALSVEKAVPFGLILTELVANAFKHAFPGCASGEITTALGNSADGRVWLRVRDNGVGLPAGLDWRASRTLGLRLIHLLAGQLKAAVEVRRNGGTEFEITFQRDAYVKR